MSTIARWSSTTRSDVCEGVRLTAAHDVQLVSEDTVVGEWDEGRIRQVVTNLVSNALKYSPSGSTVMVKVTSDGSAAQLSVHDDGIGLTEDELAQLFRRGYRTEAVRHIRGDGLGLYLARGLVVEHGGRMWAESAGPRGGRHVFFSLPLAVAPTGETSVERAS